MPTARPTVAVLGTGVIGAPVARNLARAGFTVRAWNRTAAKAEALAGDGVVPCASPAGAVRGAGIVITLLSDGPRVQEAVEAAAENLAPGTVWIQSATVGEHAPRLAGLAAELEAVFVDAPVQGTRQPAEQGALTVLAAAPGDVRPVLAPVFEAIGSRTVWVGDDASSGAASRLKLVLNTWVLTLTAGVGEALALAEGLGVDPSLFVEVVTGGPLDSGYFQGKSAAILAGDYTTSFSVDNAAKDARLVREAAQEAGLGADVVRAALARLERASAAGHGGADMAAARLAD